MSYFLKNIKKYLLQLYSSSVLLNHKNILELLDNDDKAILLDLGCDDGELTVKLSQKINTNALYGVEIEPDGIKIAKQRGIKVSKFDLNDKFKFKNDSFDIVHANQIIEHLYNTDNFISEIYRVLKKKGYAIISTENGSSWCNIFASIMGWQIFSLTNISEKRLGLGNPLAFYRDDVPKKSTWNHIRIYNIRGLKELLEIHGFKVEQIKGAGYFPLPSIIGNIDKTHSHFITFKIRKI